jgi:hypothetical protein
MIQYDWGVDANGDLDIANDDITYVLSDSLHVEDTIKAFPLWWKQFPADGVGINAYRNSVGKMQQLQGAIKQQLQIDGYIVGSPTVTITPDGTFEIDPDAIRL